jgi:hypothetical protein
MVPLDSPQWGLLRHAYGAASDVPDLLRRLAADPRPSATNNAEPWFSLWSALCHQDDVYSASYAAVPHIVATALAACGPIDFSFFLLPACIEVSRARGRGPEISPNLRDAYSASLHDLHRCALHHAEHPWSREMTRSVMAALAAAKGQIDLAETLILLSDDVMRRVLAQDW